MNESADDLLKVRRFTGLPRTVEEAREFIKEKGFDPSVVREGELQHAIDKLNGSSHLNGEDIKAFHRIIDVGDTCGCDNDHRMRGKSYFDDNRKTGYART